MELLALFLAFFIGVLVGPTIASILIPHTAERARRLLAETKAHHAETKAHHEEAERARVAAAEALACATRDLTQAKQMHDDGLALLAKATEALNGVVR